MLPLHQAPWWTAFNIILFVRYTIPYWRRPASARGETRTHGPRINGGASRYYPSFTRSRSRACSLHYRPKSVALYHLSYTRKYGRCRIRTHGRSPVGGFQDHCFKPDSANLPNTRRIFFQKNWRKYLLFASYIIIIPQNSIKVKSLRIKNFH